MAAITGGPEATSYDDRPRPEFRADKFIRHGLRSIFGWYHISSHWLRNASSIEIGTAVKAGKYLNDFAALAFLCTRGNMRRLKMKLAIVGVLLGATVLGAIPASAEIVDRDRDAVVVREGHHYGWRHHYAGCRVVKVRTTLPNGNVLVKTRRTCD